MKEVQEKQIFFKLSVIIGILEISMKLEEGVKGVKNSLTVKR